MSMPPSALMAFGRGGSAGLVLSSHQPSVVHLRWLDEVDEAR